MFYMYAQDQNIWKILRLPSHWMHNNAGFQNDYTCVPKFSSIPNLSFESGDNIFRESFTIPAQYRGHVFITCTPVLDFLPLVCTL